MKWRKRIIIVLLTVFIAIQFVQPARNIRGKQPKLSAAYPISDTVESILKDACYACHSNLTNYPWYSRIQPFGWFLARHITQGKAEINFNDLATLPVRRQITKLRGIANSVKDGSMPLRSFRLLNKRAKLSPGQKELIIEWVSNTSDSLRSLKQAGIK